MSFDVFLRNGWLVLFLLLIAGGLLVGVWNQQEIQWCHDTYDDDPSQVAECEDSFTDVVHYGSVFSVFTGVIGVLGALFNRKN
ncbi:hypothetical protein [Haladaptatus sp. GCM10026878]|uniref:hypothetical protein n=1 Tax=Haladaptatus sp. GCM10026878 TaxID=3252660 RepID=UPI0036F37227